MRESQMLNGGRRVERGLVFGGRRRGTFGGIFLWPHDLDEDFAFARLWLEVNSSSEPSRDAAREPLRGGVMLC